MFIPTQVSIHTYIPLLYQLREPAKNDFPVATITPSIQIRFPDEMADFKLWQKISKMSRVVLEI